MTNRSVFIANRGGIPIVSASAVVSTDDVRISLPAHVFRFLGTKGVIMMELSATVPAGTTASLPVLVEVNGATKPLVNTSGAALTAGVLTGVAYGEILFDKSSDTLVLTSTTV